MLSPESTRDVLCRTDMHVHSGIELQIPLTDYLQHLKRTGLVNLGVLDHLEMYDAATRSEQFARELSSRNGTLPYQPTLAGLREFFREMRELRDSTPDFHVHVGLECQGPNLGKIPEWTFEHVDLLGCCYNDGDFSVGWLQNVLPVIEQLGRIKAEHALPMVVLHHPMRARLIRYRDAFPETGQVRDTPGIFGRTAVDEVACALKEAGVLWEVNGHTCFHYMREFPAGQELFYEMHRRLAERGVDFSLGSDMHGIEGPENPLRQFVGELFPDCMQDFSALIRSAALT